MRTELLDGSMWYNNENAYELLQLQELEPHAWLTGAWQEPAEQLQLVMRTVISGMLLYEEGGTAYDASVQLQLAEPQAWLTRVEV